MRRQPLMDRRVEPARTAHLLRTKTAIAERIRRLCRHADEAEFEALVERMALVEIKYSMRRGELVIPRARHTYQ